VHTIKVFDVIKFLKYRIYPNSLGSSREQYGRPPWSDTWRRKYWAFDGFEDHSEIL